MSWLCFPLAWPSSQSSHQYFAFNPHIQVGFCLIVRSQNYTNLPDSWICGRLRVFAGVLRIFAGVLRVILGAVFCIYMRWCSGYENVLVLYVPVTQPGCKPCSVIFKMSLVVIVWPLGSKTRQTSRSRRDSENWVILGHTPKQPKIIDRRNVQVFNILTSKCASRHNGVHFFDIATSKSGPTLVCFVHFDFQMCFAPQRRALFRHRNFQKWSDHGVFCTFWLPNSNVLRATTACTFSTSQLPKVVRHWCVLYILTWKCASRHNGVHFFDISTSKSGPRPPVFNTFDFEMCFAPQRRAIFHRSCGQLAPHPPL